MRSAERRRVEGRSVVDVDVPSAWVAEVDGGADNDRGADLVLVGPRRGLGPRPRVSVRVVDGGGALCDAPVQVWEAMRRDHPQAVFTSSDVWPHPVWGAGRLVQTARVGRDSTVAHDCYVFNDAGRAVQIETECALVDLLPLEDQFADIVAHVRPKVAVA